LRGLQKREDRPGGGDGTGRPIRGGARVPQYRTWEPAKNDRKKRVKSRKVGRSGVRPDGGKIEGDGTKNLHKDGKKKTQRVFGPGGFILGGNAVAINDSRKGQKKTRRKPTRGDGRKEVG